jgi:hypothetical protein
MSAAAGMKVLGGPTGISSTQYGGRSWYGSGWGARRRSLEAPHGFSVLPGVPAKVRPDGEFTAAVEQIRGP